MVQNPSRGVMQVPFTVYSRQRQQTSTFAHEVLNELAAPFSVFQPLKWPLSQRRPFGHLLRLLAHPLSHLTTRFVAHYGPSKGHLCARATKHTFAQHFTWPHDDRASGVVRGWQHHIHAIHAL